MQGAACRATEARVGAETRRFQEEVAEARTPYLDQRSTVWVVLVKVLTPKPYQTQKELHRKVQVNLLNPNT